MKTEKVPVSYRDKEKNQNISLGEIEVQVPDTVEEAIELFGRGENGEVDRSKGEEQLLDYAAKAYVIDLQREYRDANRPDKPKGQSNLAKFKQLSPEKQEELLKAAGIIRAEATQG
jgi:hypothetical protein